MPLTARGEIIGALAFGSMRTERTWPPAAHRQCLGWTEEWFSTQHRAEALKAYCIAQNPRGGSEAGGHDQCDPSIPIPRRVVKGGSVDTGMSHVGFRCVVRP